MNADGSDMVKPLVIHKYKKPRCFGKNFNPQTICHYYFNKTAWMNMIIFKDYVLKFNANMRRKKRRVCLIVDNATGHNLSSDVIKHLTHVKIHYFSPNCTSHLQPCDAGIIKSFKAHYSLLNWLLFLLTN